MLLQLFINTSVENITSTLVIALATIITMAYLYWNDAYSRTPISALVLIGLLFTGLFGALLFQTLYWNPVTKYLHNPVLTFYKLLFYISISIFSHYIYFSLTDSQRPFTKNRIISLKSILDKLGLYDIPSVYTVWIVSIIGVMSLILGKLIPGELGRAIFNFKFLAWFPFFIVIYIHKFGNEYASPKLQHGAIAIFFCIITFLGIAFNSRGLIVAGLVNLFLLATVVLLSNKKKHHFSFYIKLSCLFIILLGLLKPFSDFSDAMLIARSERGSISPIQMLTSTFDIYLNSSNDELVDNEKFIENKIYSNYDEDYIENGIITRFVLTKFHDNAYFYASSLSEKGEEEIKKHVTSKILAIMPQPLIDMLNIDLNKMEHINSTTDILVHETTGRRLGGLKVPSTFVDIEVTFGLFSPLIFFAMSFVFFFMIDLYSKVDNKYGLIVSFPFFAIAARYVFFQLPVYGFQGIVNFLVRGFFVDVLIFCAIMFLFSFAFKPFIKYTKV